MGEKKERLNDALISSTHATKRILLLPGEEKKKKIFVRV